MGSLALTLETGAARAALTDTPSGYSSASVTFDTACKRFFDTCMDGHVPVVCTRIDISLQIAFNISGDNFIIQRLCDLTCDLALARPFTPNQAPVHDHHWRFCGRRLGNLTEETHRWDRKAVLTLQAPHSELVQPIENTLQVCCWSSGFLLQLVEEVLHRRATPNERLNHVDFPYWLGLRLRRHCPHSVNVKSCGVQTDDGTRANRALMQSVCHRSAHISEIHACIHQSQNGTRIGTAARFFRIHQHALFTRIYVCTGRHKRKHAPGITFSSASVEATGTTWPSNVVTM